MVYGNLLVLFQEPCESVSSKKCMVGDKIILILDQESEFFISIRNSCFAMISGSESMIVVRDSDASQSRFFRRFLSKRSS